MKINVPEIDKNVHLYLGYLGFKGEIAVCDKIIEWMNEEPNGVYFHDLCVEDHKKMVTRFIEANKDNEEVMNYIHSKL